MCSEAYPNNFVALVALLRRCWCRDGVGGAGFRGVSRVADSSVSTPVRSERGAAMAQMRIGPQRKLGLSLLGPWVSGAEESSSNHASERAVRVLAAAIAADSNINASIQKVWVRWRCHSPKQTAVTAVTVLDTVHEGRRASLQAHAHLHCPCCPVHTSTTTTSTNTAASEQQSSSPFLFLFLFLFLFWYHLKPFISFVLTQAKNARCCCCCCCCCCGSVGLLR